MFRFVGNLVAPRGVGGALSVLFYHRTLPAPDPILSEEMHAASFERHMAFLASEFNVIPLGEACGRLRSGTLPARALSVTFDDGYADNIAVALPILKRLRVSATFFIATAYLEGGLMFNDIVIEAVRTAVRGRHDLSSFGVGVVDLDGASGRRAAVDRLIGELKYRPVDERAALVERLAELLGSQLPRRLMMTHADIRTLHGAGMEIGAHTVSHPILKSLTDEEARKEIATSKRVLEEIIGEPVKVFAYPNGKPGADYGPQHVRMVKEAGFSAAVSTVHGICHAGSDLYQLPRIGPWDASPRRLAARLLCMCAVERVPGIPRTLFSRSRLERLSGGGPSS